MHRMRKRKPNPLTSACKAAGRLRPRWLFSPGFLCAAMYLDHSRSPVRETNGGDCLPSWSPIFCTRLCQAARYYILEVPSPRSIGVFQESSITYIFGEFEMAAASTKSSSYAIWARIRSALPIANGGKSANFSGVGDIEKAGKTSRGGDAQGKDRVGTYLDL